MFSRVHSHTPFSACSYTKETGKQAPGAEADADSGLAPLDEETQKRAKEEAQALGGSVSVDVISRYLRQIQGLKDQLASTKATLKATKAANDCTTLLCSHQPMVIAPTFLHPAPALPVCHSNERQL